MKFCANCGEKLKEGVEFCPNCGSKKGEVKTSPHQDKHKVQKKDNSKRILLILLIFFWPAGLIYYFVKRTTIKEITEKNWFLNHPFLTWLIVMFSIGILMSFVPSDNQNYSSTPSETTSKTKTIQKAYVDEDLTDLIFKYVSMNSIMTDIQKKESFKQIKGKYIQSEGIVIEVNEAFGTPVVAIMNPENEFLRGATIYFKKSEKDKLLNIGKYDSIDFEGKIEDYGSFMGIIIHEAEVK